MIKVVNKECYCMKLKYIVYSSDLMRQQEELRRIEEMRNEQMRRRQEFDSRFVLVLESVFIFHTI